MDKKNLIRVPMVITKQSHYHLCHICAMNGWGEKDIGRAVDKVTTAFRNNDRRIGHWIYRKSFIGTYCECSVCHFTSGIDSRYCPECGSLLKGGSYAKIRNKT